MRSLGLGFAADPRGFSAAAVALCCGVVCWCVVVDSAWLIAGSLNVVAESVIAADDLSVLDGVCTAAFV